VFFAYRQSAAVTAQRIQAMEAVVEPDAYDGLVAGSRDTAPGLARKGTGRAPTPNFHVRDGSGHVKQPET
jgi:hypothetical protein